MSNLEITGKTIRYSLLLLMVMFLAIFQTGCGGHITIEPTVSVHPSKTPGPTTIKTNPPEATNTLLPTETFHPTPTKRKAPEPTHTLLPARTLTPTSARANNVSSTPIPKLDTTWQAWHTTAIAVKATERASFQLAEKDKATQIAQFPLACEDINFYQSNISPDGKWFAASCGTKRNPTLIVEEKEGKKWVLAFKDLISPDTPDGIAGMVTPIFWSPEGEYLYFSTEKGYSGGGDECFPYGRGYYGLFRLSLKAGSWVILAPPTDAFPGYEIEFSPSGRYYAITMNSIMITDLKTGEITEIEISGVQQDMIWSPDSQHLAYSEASCGDFFVQSSSVYVWDVLTNKPHILFCKEGILLRPESWIDHSTLRIEGTKFDGHDLIYTIYEYDLVTNNMLSCTATPYP